ncbi:hypothetical protein A8806_103105 [Faecalicatena orotica]|uniref:Uncharacterized protein n=1 Tax=Faecalicatena orotica TaxID=1544 RepID=A0A2Y9BF10_9FIRM|nr:hypothetical protein A8806_103105 [Faecalicatena orotica]SSA54862.1 hypothetical protein SAMN05216536_103105 [Faecalicatena orotica]
MCKRAMDSIGSSTRLLWFFVFIMGVPVILLICSMLLWSYNRFKHLAFISYIAEVILTIFIIYISISNIVSRLPWNEVIYYRYVGNSILIIMSVLSTIGSLFFFRRYKKISNIFMNISSLLVVIVWVIIIDTANM